MFTSFRSIHEYVDWDEFNPDAFSQEMIRIMINPGIVMHYLGSEEF